MFARVIARHVSPRLSTSQLPRLVPRLTPSLTTCPYPCPIRFKATTSSRNNNIMKLLKKKLPPSLDSNSSTDSDHNYMHDEDPGIYNMVQPVAPNELYVSCTVFDDRGNITGVSRKYPRVQFLRDNNLFARDLRKIDTSSIEVVPTIMVRSSNTILVNLAHIKAIIKKDTIMIFDTSNPLVAKRLGIFMYDLEMKLKLPAGNVCYEFRALESILINVMSYLEAELKAHLSSCGQILAELEDQVNREKLQELLIRSKQISSYYQKTVLIRDVLEELLDNDEDLAGMYLTDPKKFDPKVEDYEDLEMILEAYYKQCDEFVQQAGSLVNDIKVTEDIVNIMLDANRNSLMLFELKITIFTLGFTVATLLPAFYGMNLKNYIEESNLGFGAVVVVSVIQGLIFTYINFKKLHRVQRLTMMGTHDSRKMAKNNYKFHHSSSPVGTFYKDKWYYRLIYGSRNSRYDPSVKEKDVIWRMINDDKPNR
ncbi:inner membrane magnesium transporter MRS2, mitochondrial precursor [Scheffersomyces amazonensis]|uniref:inner membrane magnesium transporter MRS2, mitochondrial precursor n=1 Tax=Scheffersomyces amazonensis TaxID=1078765 RepID=UPI00315CCA99